MPKRMLRDWTDSRKFDGITAESERLFTRLIMKADDFGRYYGDSRLIRAHCYPLFDDLKPNFVDAWLDQLIARKLVLLYTVNGENYLAIVNYGQRLKQSRAKFPQPDGKQADFLPTDEYFRQLPGTSGGFPPEGKGREGTGTGEAEEEAEVEGACEKLPATMDDLCAQFPNIDVWNEYQKLKTRCEKKGEGKPSIGSLVAWLKKATPTASIKKAITKKEEPEEQPISLEEQAEIAKALAVWKTGFMTNGSEPQQNEADRRLLLEGQRQEIQNRNG